jgi:zinc and cadmium transporter
MTIALTTVAGAIAAYLAVSLCSLSSVFALWLKHETLKWLVPNLVALAVGVLLGDAFIHLIPDAVQRHDHNVDCRPTDDHILPLAKMNLIGDAMHNFVDGILIAGSFLADPLMGLTTTLAIVAHEIPQELGDVGALLRGGFTPRQAVLYNFYCSLTVLPGAVFTLLLSQVAESSLIVLLPIAAGGFIYIAASDLIPVLHERSSLTHLGGQSISFATGIGFMQFIVIFEQALLAA